ncbi:MULTISPECIES: hypothetical protein [unclassified Paraburkholderia]|uniref:hypothetical protein n=1 Tax=unclassified Paraburkholderia TaxID=2615204 RepID=UPI00160AC797|nr:MULTISPECIES: hypothetical protein [unclassified Paraburkholderia]MBB5447118.1 hypothetical protein [Paraburkholderia sp. WSM4177]MBB5487659.1 hypothetical protein [Paraburkholderia sp. WSM4180]
MFDKPALDTNERPAYLALADELIRYDTTSSRLNLGLIEAIRDRLRTDHIEALRLARHGVAAWLCLRTFPIIALMQWSVRSPLRVI